MCARNIKPENERWVLGMERRLASQTMPDGGSSRLAELLGERRGRGKKDPSHFRGGRRRRSALSAALRRVCAETRVVSSSQLSVPTHTAILFSLSTTARARAPCS